MKISIRTRVRIQKKFMKFCWDREVPQKCFEFDQLFLYSTSNERWCSWQFYLFLLPMSSCCGRQFFTRTMLPMGKMRKGMVSVLVVLTKGRRYWFRYRAVSRIPNPNPKAANSLPLRLFFYSGLGLGIRGLHW